MTEPDISACAGIVQKADPDRFAAVMAAPVAMRSVLFPLHALAVEVARAPWATKEEMIAEMRIQWWRDALAEIAEGRPVRRHEVVSPLADILNPETAAMLDGFVEVRRWDVYKEPFEDEAHFRDYLVQSSGSLYRAMCQALGQSDDGCDDFGYAAGLANYLIAVPKLEEFGRIPLLDGRPEAVQSLAKTGLDALTSAKRQNPSRAVRQVYLAGWQTKAILTKAVRNPMLVAQGALQSGEFSKRGRLMWKAFTGGI